METKKIDGAHLIFVGMIIIAICMVLAAAL